VSHEDSQDQAVISRRRMLKRVGAGAAIAWTAPILTSVRSPAFAASPQCGCPPLTCVPPPQTCSNGCECNPPHNGGPCVCSVAEFCVPNGNICNTDADCAAFGPPVPPGSKCTDVNCPEICGSAQTACSDPTGCTGARAVGRRQGLKAVVR